MNKSMKITERTREILRAEKAAREKSNTFVSMVSLMEEAVVFAFTVERLTTITSVSPESPSPSEV